MTLPRPPKPCWRELFSNSGFPFYFAAMFVSLFGTGMNFAGVTLYVLAKTHSTVQVSLTVILLTLPRLLVPPLGGVLTDRVDRRYLSIILDLGRAAIVAAAALLAWRGRLELWQLYGMVLLLGVGFAIYWSSSLALLQEVIPPAQLVSANSAVLIAVQGGMLAAGAMTRFADGNMRIGAIGNMQAQCVQRMGEVGRIIDELTGPQALTLILLGVAWLGPGSFSRRNDVAAAR